MASDITEDDVLYSGNLIELSMDFPDVEIMIADKAENGPRFHISDGVLTKRTPEGWVEV